MKIKYDVRPTHINFPFFCYIQHNQVSALNWSGNDRKGILVFIRQCKSVTPLKQNFMSFSNNCILLQFSISADRKSKTKDTRSFISSYSVKRRTLYVLVSSCIVYKLIWNTILNDFYDYQRINWQLSDIQLNFASISLILLKDSLHFLFILFVSHKCVSISMWH